MSNMANITVFDGAATPVSHTLVGEVIKQGSDGSMTAVWKESNSAIPDDAQIRVTMTKKRLKTGTFIVSIKSEVPVMETVSNQNSSGYTAPPKVAHVVTEEFVGKFSGRSLVSERRLCRQILINVLGNVTTTVAPVATGFAPELIDQLIVAT